MKAERIFETILYADDLAAAETFYRDVMGLEVYSRFAVAVSFRCGHCALLIFDPSKSEAAGRPVPSHGSRGPWHLAFGVRDDELEGWRQHLCAKGVAIEKEVDWDEGGRSIYFRDPAGNSIELAPPTLWGGGWSFE